MERVAYRLGCDLGLPIPATHLEHVGGHASSVQRWVTDSRSWIQAGGSPMMTNTILNESVYAAAALFDVWMANTDRRQVNLMFEPHPPGTAPARATACRLWLIDHGQCGLWPADKLERGRDAGDIPDSVTNITGAMWDNAEIVIGALMPPEYRIALKNTTGPARDHLLDRVRSIGDDVIRSTVMEVPHEYMSDGQRDATVAFLKGRRDMLDTVVSTYW
jgi:hypothetical protein